MTPNEPSDKTGCLTALFIPFFIATLILVWVETDTSRTLRECVRFAVEIRPGESETLHFPEGHFSAPRHRLQFGFRDIDGPLLDHHRQSTSQLGIGRDDSGVVSVTARDESGVLLFSEVLSARACVSESANSNLRHHGWDLRLCAGLAGERITWSRVRSLELEYLEQEVLEQDAPWVIYLTDNTDLMYTHMPRILARLLLLALVPITIGLAAVIFIRRRSRLARASSGYGVAAAPTS